MRFHIYTVTFHFHHKRNSWAADLSVWKKSRGFPNRSLLQQIPSWVQMEAAQFSLKDAALNTRLWLHARSSEALLIVIIKNSDSNVLMRPFVLPRETDEQHHWGCKDAEHKLFAGPLKDGPVLSIIFIAQAKENAPKLPQNAWWITDSDLRTDPLSELNWDASKVENQFSDFCSKTWIKWKYAFKQRKIRANYSRKHFLESVLFHTST